MKANEHPDWETYKNITTPHDGDWSYETFVKNYVNKMTYFKRRKEVIDNFPWETAELKFIHLTFNNRAIENKNVAIGHYEIEYNEFKPRYDKELKGAIESKIQKKYAKIQQNKVKNRR